MAINRRDLFKIAGGAATGFLFTPIPWRSLQDTALWSQNWSSIPRPPRGERRVRFTTCALCPAGCGIRARCVGDQPVGLTGVTGHPISHGVICPLGLSAHQFPYHPLRFTQPLIRSDKNGEREFTPVALDAAVARIQAAVKQTPKTESVAILDGRPGRTASLLYRKFAASMQNGLYLAPPAETCTTLRVLESMFDKPVGPLGFDLENTRTLVSFGAPVLDSWGTPGRMMEIFRRRPDPPRLIQIEPRESTTAALADQWIAIQPGSEAAFALSLVHVLLTEKLRPLPAGQADYLTVVEKFTPEFVAGITNVAPDLLRHTARTIARSGPAIVIGGGDPGAGPFTHDEERAIAALNLVFGSVGSIGGIAPRRPVPLPDELQAREAESGMELDRVPDHSIRVLILTEAAPSDAFPWTVIEKKLVPDGRLVIGLTPYVSSQARHADLLIPTPAHLETLQDAPTPPGARVTSFSLAAPLLAPPSGTIEPVDFLNRIGGSDALGTLAGRLKQRVASIHASHRGQVFSSSNGRITPVSDIARADDLWKTLSEGGCWTDSETSAGPLPGFSLAGKTPEAAARLAKAGEGRLSATTQTSEFPLILVPYGERGMAGGVAPPLFTKLYQESDLRAPAHRVAMNPETALRLGLADGAGVVVQTPCGACRKLLHLDPSVRPGLIEASVGPGPDALLGVKSPEPGVLEVCSVDDGCTWRLTRARVQTA